MRPPASSSYEKVNNTCKLATRRLPSNRISADSGSHQHTGTMSSKCSDPSQSPMTPGPAPPDNNSTAEHAHASHGSTSVPVTQATEPDRRSLSATQKCPRSEVSHPTVLLPRPELLAKGSSTAETGDTGLPVRSKYFFGRGLVYLSKSSRRADTGTE